MYLIIARTLKERSRSRTKQNHYFVASEHIPAAAPEGRSKGIAEGFIGGHKWPILF